MFDFFKKAAECYIDTMRFYKAVYELSNLSDEDLKDLGMHRTEIPFVAMKASIKN
jgi:uncharacterized protein YjiS (DUF1127 family)